MTGGSATSGLNGSDVSRDLHRLFAPSSIAVVGASTNPSSISGRPLRILRRHGYEGRLYAVNPKYERVAEVPCYPSVRELPETPDVVILALSARSVPRVLDECGELGTRNAIVISSGFEEDDSASELVEELKSVVLRHGINVVGPNSEGVWSVPHRAMMTFGSAALRDRIAEGPISVISQSGSIGGNTARGLQERGLACRFFISAGNETVLSAADYLEFIADEGGTQVVLLFLEGLKDGPRFLRAVERAHEAGVEIVALKAGASAAGSAAVASHTGKITSPADVYADIFEQAGILQVQSIGDLVEAAEVLTTPLLRLQSADHSDGGKRRRGVGIVAPGATRTVMADAAEALGVPLAEFSEETEAALSDVIPSYGSARNPVDVTAQVSTGGMFEDVLDVMGRDSATEALIIQWGNRGMHRVAEIQASGHEVQKSINKPVVVGFLGEPWELDGEARSGFRSLGLGSAVAPEAAVRQVSWLFRSRDFRGRRRQRRRPGQDSSGSAGGGLQLAVDWAGSTTWLEACGFSVPRWIEVDPRVPDWVGQLESAQLSYPIVAKAHPDEVLHKADRGLVVTDLRSADEAVSAMKQLAGSAPDVRRYLLQEMVEPGAEALVTIRQDHDFGPVLTIGVGGALVELINSVRHLALPISRSELEDAIDRTRLGALLTGLRGRSGRDRPAFVDAVLACANQFVGSPGTIAEIELNPVIIGPEGSGAAVVDVISRPAHPGG